ncbi:hypothetical protein [Lunatimonas salinarum]|uniref:hypothetical protein n=1 Tax=Lunatimonas salinarum TaxID=1774590 RepID=UPI001ADEDDD8|nr:hypothetical protein [Lunatimonas salinarum]
MKPLLFISVFIFLFTPKMYAQEKLSIEVYAGPAIGYVDGEGKSPTEEIRFFETTGYHVGLRVLNRISSHLQLFVEGEYFNRPVGQRVIQTDGMIIETRDGRYSNNFGNYALGIRYLLKGGKTGVYFQPSVGFGLNRETPGFFGSSNPRQTPTMRTSLSGRLELGVRRIIGNNYVLFGVRHHQGFQQLDGGVEFFSGQDLTVDFRSSASYSTVFLGFGIPTRWFAK